MHQQTNEWPDHTPREVYRPDPVKAPPGVALLASTRRYQRFDCGDVECPYCGADFTLDTDESYDTEVVCRRCLGVYAVAIDVSTQVEVTPVTELEPGALTLEDYERVGQIRLLPREAVVRLPDIN